MVPVLRALDGDVSEEALPLHTILAGRAFTIQDLVVATGEGATHPGVGLSYPEGGTPRGPRPHSGGHVARNVALAASPGRPPPSCWWPRPGSTIGTR